MALNFLVKNKLFFFQHVGFSRVTMTVQWFKICVKGYEYNIT